MYVDESRSPATAPRGVILVSDMDVVLPVNDADTSASPLAAATSPKASPTAASADKFRFQFMLRTLSGTDYLLRARSEASRQDWIECIQDVMVCHPHAGCSCAVAEQGVAPS